MTWTRERLEKYREKKWVIDGGSLQVIKPEWIPQKAILTPNQKEFEMLFSTSPLTPLHSYGEGNERGEVVAEMARKYSCIIVYKGPTAYVTDGYTTYEIKGGNAGLTKGGTGDVLAGVTVGLAAKNEPLLAAAAASFIVKKTADELYEKVGYHFNADDLAEEVFGTFHQLLGPIG
jgi:NAD(P)H-hydrate epimerase